MAKFSIKSVKVRNYRAFRELEAGGFGQFNIIGGLNGAGKSTLLEAIFFALDRVNPASVFRPFNWRLPGFPGTDLEEALEQTFHKNEVASPISVELDTNRGSFGIALTHGIAGQTLPSTSTPVGTASITPNGFLTLDGPQGYVLRGTHAGTEDFHAVAQVAQGAINAQVHKSPTALTPKCVLLNSSTRRNNVENVVRFSSVVKDNRVPQLLEVLKIVHPNIDDLQIISTSGYIDLHAKVPGGGWTPLSFLGEGASTLVTVALSIYECRGGVAIFDEFDTAIHHTLMQQAWRSVFQFAHNFDVQLFCSTHSLESVEAALAAAKDLNKGKLSYTRIHRADEGKPQATHYDAQKLSWAIEDNWEIR